MKSHVCLECGEMFEGMAALRLHWRSYGHGPKQAQLDAIDRARFSIMGEAAPEPEKADGRAPRPELTP